MPEGQKGGAVGLGSMLKGKSILFCASLLVGICFFEGHVIRNKTGTECIYLIVLLPASSFRHGKPCHLPPGGRQKKKSRKALFLLLVRENVFNTASENRTYFIKHVSVISHDLVFIVFINNMITNSRLLG